MAPAISAARCMPNWTAPRPTIRTIGRPVGISEKGGLRLRDDLERQTVADGQIVAVRSKVGSRRELALRRQQSSGSGTTVTNATGSSSPLPMRARRQRRVARAQSACHDDSACATTSLTNVRLHRPWKPSPEALPTKHRRNRKESQKEPRARNAGVVQW